MRISDWSSDVCSSDLADWFRPLYDFHSFQVLPRLGKLFAQDADSYQYLAESIRKHPPQDELKAMMEAAGFDRCDYRNLSGGIVAIHTGYRRSEEHTSELPSLMRTSYAVFCLKKTTQKPSAIRTR